MKAIQVHEFGGPEVMKLETASEPKVGPGQLLIDVSYAGVNPVDTLFRSGTRPLVDMMNLPWTPGIDASGIVTSIGEGVEGFTIGDKVFGMTNSGSYAEKATLNAIQTAKLPSNISLKDGASLPIVIYTAYYALVHKGGLKAGETVLINGGAGGVGMMAIQIAKACGARVITTVSTKEKADFCRKLGADEVINYKEEDFVAKTLSLTNGRGVELVIEPVAAENFEKDADVLSHYGRLVLLGIGTGKSPEGTIHYPSFYMKDIEIKTMALFNAGPVFPEMIKNVQVLLESGKIKPFVGESFAVKEAPKAHERLMQGGFCGKIVLEV